MLQRRQLPIDGIKIDRCFVSDILDSNVDATITRGLVTIAQGLGISIVAEGVETEAQRDVLLQYGVAQLQGYLFAKPQPAADFARELARGGESFFEQLPPL